MSTKIIQWNINGFSPQKEQLQLMIRNINPNIICLQETNFKADKYHSLNNYKIAYKNRTNTSHASGGVAIYIKNSFAWKETPINSNLEVIATKNPFKVWSTNSLQYLSTE